MRDAFFHRGRMILRTVAALTGSRSEIVVTPPSWRVCIARWTAAFVVCWLFYQAYAWVMVPWIEPGVRPAARAELPDNAGENRAERGDAQLAALFPPTAWERNNPMELKTQWGRLLFQEYVRVDNGVELHPCTILFQAPATRKDGSPGHRTIVLKTEDKAVLSFSGKLNFVHPQVGKLEGGLLDGKVKIYARETFAGANDALNIVTRKVQIRPEQIWTPHDVAFEYGSSRGSGRVLSIDMDPDKETEQSASHGSLMRGIKMLELVHLDGLHLDFPGQGLLGKRADQTDPPDPSPKRSENDSTETRQNTAVDVTCRGPLKFDFQQRVATLQEHVDVVRPNPHGDDDHLHCDRLRIHFNAEDPTDSSHAATAKTASPDSKGAKTSTKEHSVPDMAVRRIEATGSEVTLQAPSVRAAARGRRLQYDFHTRRVLLEDPREALFAYRQHVVKSRRLEYELQEETTRLGKLWAKGPGNYSRKMDQWEQPLQVNWQGTLQLKPQDDLHVLSVTDGADIQWGSANRFAADKIFVWLAEVPSSHDPDDLAATNVRTVVQTSHSADNTEPTSDTPVLTPPNNVSPEDSADDKKTDVRPVKMLAQGDVEAHTEQFDGETTQLEIWFEYPDASRPPAKQNSKGQQDHTSDKTAPSPADPGPAEQPNADAHSDQAPKTKASKRTVDKYELSGTQIRLRLKMIQPQPRVSEATVSGQVHFAQLPPETTDSTPLRITGNMLRIQTDHLDRATIDVRGDASRQARVNAQGLTLEGSNLHLSQRRNLIWSEGPGQASLPAELNRNQPSSADRPAAESYPVSPQSPIRITWRHGMDFDGQLVRFMEHVKVSGIYRSQKGEQHHVRSFGNQLHATLDRYVDFSKSKKTDDLDVVELRFLGDVRTENQTFDEQQQLISRDYMQSRDLTLDRPTGDFTALGPGWITSTRVDGRETNKPTSSTDSSRTGRGNTNQNRSAPLVYLRIDYQNEIRGNIELREGKFMHFVRTVYGPVQSWDQTLDPNRRDGLGPKGILMTCNTLKIAEMPAGKERAIEMSAIGNTVVEGNRFRAKAERLTYVEAKEQLIFEGSKRNLATLQQRARVGAEPDEFQARKIIYGIESGMVDVSGAAKLNYNQLGSPEDIPEARIR